MKKRIICIIICFIIIASLSTIIFLNNNNKYDTTIINETFEYGESFGEEVIESEYYYSDSYFSKKSSKDNEHLRTFAMGLSFAFMPAITGDSVNYYIQKIFDDIKLKDSKYYDYEIINKDTIGTALAHKKLNDKYELVVLVIRGSGYEDEWISNFTIGNEGNAKGFDDSAKLVLTRLKDYISDNNIGKYKLLITGYSRGGAVANIVGVNINNDTSYNIDKDDLYVYTYDAAKGSNDDKVYDNIHNIVNKNDLVPYLYPEQIKMYNNGNVYDITDNSRTVKSKCLNIFSDNIVVDNGEVNKKEFLTGFIQLFSDNREDYIEVTKSIINIYSLVRSKTDKDLVKLFDFIMNNNTNNIEIRDLLSILSSNNDKKIREVFNKLMSNYDKNYSDIKNILSKEEYDKLKDDIYVFFKFFLPMLKKDFSYEINGKTCSMYNTLTFISNIKDIIIEHTFENNYELVKSKDSNYK